MPFVTTLCVTLNNILLVIEYTQFKTYIYHAGLSKSDNIMHKM